MKSNIGIWAALCLAAVVGAGPADAGRVVVDFDPDGNPHYGFTHGYCDFDGVDCTPTTLSYSVDFLSATGDHFTSNSVLNYGDGSLFFLDATGVPDAFSVALGSYYQPMITGGLDRSFSKDYFFNTAFDQSTSMQVLANGTIELVAYYCVSTSSCHNTNYVLDLVPQADGFRGTVTYSMNDNTVYGYSISPFDAADSNFTGISNTAGKTYSFFVPAAITGLPDVSTPGVPEPATWVSLLCGFAWIGIANRKRKAALGAVRERATQ